MKVAICFFLLSMVLFSTKAQTDFQKTFDFSTGDYLTDMILTSDNNLLLCGYTMYGILVIKADLNGEVIWQKDFHWSVNAKAHDICESPTHFYYLGGQYGSTVGLAMKINKDGDSINTRIYNNTSDTYVFAIGALDSQIIISREKEYPGISFGYTDIILTDTLFTNSTIFGTYDGKMIHEIFVTNNDCYFMGWDVFNNYAFIIKAYSFNNVYEVDEPQDLLVINDGSIYFSYYGSGYSGSIKKTNEEGDILWTSTLLNGYYSTYSMCDYKSKLIATGSKANQYYFSIIDTTDGLVDTTFLFNDYNTQIGKAIAINGDDLYIAGYFKESASVNDYDIFLNKYSLDTLLTGIDKKDKYFDKLKVYPNPAKDWVVFELSGSAKQQGKKNAISICDVSGQKVGEIEIIGKEETTFDCRHLPTGIYFYQIKTSEKNYSGKFLIIK